MRMRQSEVQNFDSPLFCDEQVFWLEVAVRNSFFVRRCQALRDLHSIIYGLARRQAPTSETFSERLALQKFCNDVGHAHVRSHLEDGENVGMIQGRGGSRFLFKTNQPVRFGGKSGQYFDCNIAVQPRVSRTIHLAHRTRSKRRENLVLPKFRARGQEHPVAIIARIGDVAAWDVWRLSELLGVTLDRLKAHASTIRPVHLANSR